MKIALISTPDFQQGEIEIVQTILTSELEHFHLRKPGAEKKIVRQWIKKMNPIYYSKISLHSHFDLALEFQLGGVHFTEKHKAEPNWRNKAHELQKQGFRVSFSSHNLYELDFDSTIFEYAFFSPLFNSISKTEIKGRDDYDTISKMLNIYQNKVFALGGCCLENLENIKSLGFYGAAFLGAVWNQPDPVNALKEIAARSLLV